MNNQLVSFLQEKIGTKKQNHQDLSLLTIVIPSYCRQDFIIRQCAYWHGCGASVVIMDGSPKRLSNNLQQVLAGLGDITYQHSATGIVDRLKHAAALIKTPYAVMCGDDEFLLRSGLCSAIRLLEKNPDLVACIGQSLRYYLSNDGSKTNYGNGYDTYGYEVRHDNVQDRLNASVKNYNAATCYAVTRSPVWCKSWGNLQRCSSSFVIELEHAFTTYIWGKLASVDDVYWMRSDENPAAMTIDYDRLPLEEWWMSNKFEAEKVNFVTKLGDELISAQNVDRTYAETLVTSAFEIFLREQKYPSNSSVHQKCRQFAMNILKEWLPKIWVGRLIQLRSRLGLIAPATGNFGNLVDLKATETPLPFIFNDELISELSAMEKLIADFYKARSDQSE